MTDEAWRPGADMDTLRLRARILAGIRAFFSARDCLEVETPVLGSETVTDPNIDSLHIAGTSPRYLQTSPEYHMKRLLAAGSGPIFQLARVFRRGEQGQRHNPEFTMVEWYRPGFDYHQLMDEVAALVSLVFELAGEIPGAVAQPRRHTWQALFQEHLRLDPLTADWQALHACLPATLGTVQGLVEGERDALLDLLFASVIQPTLTGLVFVCDYPSSQAALARLRADDSRFAERFEVFVDGIEIGNGFTELTDALEQRRRFERDQQIRRARGELVPAIDEAMLSALAAGLPDCAGVALGLERLLMAVTGAGDIGEVMAFAWTRA